MRQLVVVVVSAEELLDRLSSELQEVGLELLVFHVTPLLVNVLLIKVVFLWRHKRRFKFLLVQIIPGEVAQPRMTLDFMNSVGSQSILRLPLDHFVDEIGGFN